MVLLLALWVTILEYLFQSTHVFHMYVYQTHSFVIASI